MVAAESLADQAVSSGIQASSPPTSPAATAGLFLAMICTWAQRPLSAAAAAYVAATVVHVGTYASGTAITAPSEHATGGLLAVDRAVRVPSEVATGVT